MEKRESKKKKSRIRSNRLKSQKSLGKSESVLIEEFKISTLGMISDSYVNMSVVEVNRKIMRDISHCVSILSKKPFKTKLKLLESDHVNEIHYTDTIVSPYLQ